MTMNRIFLLLPMLPQLLGCGSRSTSVIEDSGAMLDQVSAADTPRILDGRPSSDRGAVDRGVAPDADTATPAFCAGPPAAEVDQVPYKVAAVEGHLDLVGSCCPPGEVVTFSGQDPAGQAVKITLQIARYSGVTLPPTIKVNLAQPPSGWVFGVHCDPSKHCGLMSSGDSAFEGWIEITSLVGAPAVQVSACVSAAPKTPSPYQKPVKLWAGKVTVNTVCAPGLDSMCNHDPKVSSLRGTCQSDSTCACVAGAKKMPDGKCL